MTEDIARANDFFLDRLLRTPKAALFAVFVPLILVASVSVGWQAALAHLLWAVAGAITIELVVGRIDGRTWSWPTSALLSGLIVGLVLGPEQTGAVTMAVGAWATASKYIVRSGRAHVLNPAAVALLVSVPLLSTTQSWWGALAELPVPWVVVLLAAGAVIVAKVNKGPTVLTFLATYFALLTVLAFTEPTRVAELFRAPFVQAALFFACFMLTDPPTSPARIQEQVVIGPLVAVASVGAQLLGFGQVYLLIGLLTGNVTLAAWRRIEATRARRSRTLAARRSHSVGGPLPTGA